MITRSGGLFCTLSVALFLASFQCAHGDVDIYWTLYGGFSPSHPTASPGERVTWWNVDPDGYPVTITVSGLFPFTLYQYEGAYTDFPDPGTHQMQDNYWNTGTLTVGELTPPPTVTITNPVNGAVLPANVPFDIEVTTISEVGIVSAQFYVEDLSDYSFTLITEDFTEPFSATTNLTEGSYNLYVYVTDNNSQQAVDMISVSVAPAPPTLIGLENPRNAGGQFLFDVTGLTIGKTNVLEYCTNLSVGSWIPLATNTATSASTTVTNASTAEPRFYRISEEWP